MKIGLVVECYVGGQDVFVYEHFARQIDSDVEIVRTITMTEKKNLVLNCGEQAKLLLDDGCELVLIIWDLQPRWDAGKTLSCRWDVANIRKSLIAHDADTERVRLLCVASAMETWLIADVRGIEGFLGRSCKLPRYSTPESVKRPKWFLIDVCAPNGKTYVPTTDAIKVAQAIPDFRRLRRVNSFNRFENLILATAAPCQRHELPAPE